MPRDAPVMTTFLPANFLVGIPSHLPGGLLSEVSEVGLELDGEAKMCPWSKGEKLEVWKN